MKGKVYCKVALVILGLVVGLICTPKARAQDTVKLELWIGEARPAYKKVVVEAAEAFSKQHPNIEVKVAQMLPKDISMKWQAAAAAGTLPDITWVYSHWIGSLHDMEGAGLLPIDDIIKELGGDEKFDLLGDWEYEGAHRGIPFLRLMSWLTYRADLFAKAGLKEPKTWTDVLEAAKKLNDPDKNFYGIGMAAGVKAYACRRAIECILYGYGGQTMDKNCKPVYNSPETIAALKMFKDLFQYAPPGAVSWYYMDPIRAFGMGRTAMCISYSTTLNIIAKSSPDLVNHVRLTLPYETVPNVTHQDSRGWSIFANTKHRKEAKMFFKYLFSPKTVGDFCSVVPLVCIPAYRHPEAKKRVMETDFAKLFPAEVADKAFSQVRGFIAGQGECGVNKWSGIFSGQHVFETGLNNMLTQGWTAEKTAAWTQEQMEKIIRENP